MWIINKIINIIIQNICIFEFIGLILVITSAKSIYIHIISINTSIEF